jgi:hypothetical protein
MLTGQNATGTAHWARLQTDDLWRDSNPSDEVMCWCRDTYGSEGPGLPNDRWCEYRGKFWFRDEKDLAVFVLRWS